MVFASWTAFFMDVVVLYKYPFNAHCHFTLFPVTQFLSFVYFKYFNLLALFYMCVLSAFMYVIPCVCHVK